MSSPKSQTAHAELARNILPQPLAGSVKH